MDNLFNCWVSSYVNFNIDLWQNKNWLKSKPSFTLASKNPNRIRMGNLQRAHGENDQRRDYKVTQQKIHTYFSFTIKIYAKYA